jgi:hypothetical protein
MNTIEKIAALHDLSWPRVMLKCSAIKVKGFLILPIFVKNCQHSDCDYVVLLNLKFHHERSAGFLELEHT